MRNRSAAHAIAARQARPRVAVCRWTKSWSTIIFFAADLAVAWKDDVAARACRSRCMSMVLSSRMDPRRIIQHDMCRPSGLNRFSAGLDSNGLSCRLGGIALQFLRLLCAITAGRTAFK